MANRSHTSPTTLTVGAVLLLLGSVWVGWLLWSDRPMSSVWASVPDDRNGDRAVLRVLFIGNSLTYTNNLPEMVEKLSRANADGPVIEAHSITAGGFGLVDHLNAGVLDRIAEEKWDFVILQQGPSSLPESRASLLEHAREFASVIRDAGATPAFYMVWPEERYFHTFDRACESYRLAAKEVDGLLLPVGEAWWATWRRDDSILLYGGDLFHPSPTGTYLAALVITSQLTGSLPAQAVSPDELEIPSLLLRKISPTRARTLVAATEDAIAAEKSRPPTTRHGD